MTKNIELEREVTPEDLADVVEAAGAECVCTLEMKRGLVHGDETVCVSCAARQILNGVTTLAEKL